MKDSCEYHPSPEGGMLRSVVGHKTNKETKEITMTSQVENGHELGSAVTPIVADSLRVSTRSVTTSKVWHAALAVDELYTGGHTVVSKGGFGVPAFIASACSGDVTLVSVDSGRRLATLQQDRYEELRESLTAFAVHNEHVVAATSTLMIRHFKVGPAKLGGKEDQKSDSNCLSIECDRSWGSLHVGVDATVPLGLHKVTKSFLSERACQFRRWLTVQPEPFVRQDQQTALQRSLTRTRATALSVFTCIALT